DRITVLKNGRRVAAFERGQATRLALVEAMLGRAPPAASSREKERASRGVVLEALRVEGPGLDGRFDLRIAAREALGLPGLLGSGRSELLRLLAGADRRTAGA